jgi:hypothetical protein
MFKSRLFFICIIASISLQAQTGIGTTTPHASAKLDVSANNKGFLPPRVTLSSTTDVSTIPSPAEGLLVYNLGSVGIQAGYYYWNGANWATIATATSAGNGVTSMDMVKLYGEVHSKASGKIGNSTTGYAFTVPVSGRYLFDFTSSATTLSGGTNTIYFTVRQGTTVLGSDNQSSYNNNVHVEYNGKVEVNLQAGVNYNVYNYATSGSFEGNDYDRVYYKLVAGNIPVTGQSVDYIQASLSANQVLSSAGNINFNVSSGAGISLSSGGFNLIANKTYKLEAAIGGSSGGYAYYGWVDNTNTLLAGGSIGVVMKAGAAYTDAPQDKAIVYFTPTVNTTVYLRVFSLSGTLTAYTPNAAAAYSSTWANIAQIGSSAIINPWILSGTNTYNTTGNVGIGTATPNASALLDLTSTTKAFLPPRMTTAQRNAISPVTAGLVIYNTTINQLETYTGSGWSALYSGNAFHYAQYRANAIQNGFTADVTKVNFPTPVINSGSIAISSGNTFTLPANRIYRVDVNMGWKDGGWCRFGIYNASTGAILSQTAHMEGGAASGSGTISYFVDATAGSVNIDVRLKAGGCSLNDPNNGGTFATITIQSIF